jgi:radical SAM protein with 4Fe4S-binding SPASM domain
MEQLKELGYTQIQIETQSRCNMACSFCAYPLKQNKNAILPTAKVYEIIDSLDPNDINWLNFHQLSEPLLDDRIYDFVKHAKSRGFITQIATNGLLFNKSNTDRLLDTEPAHIRISFQTISEQSFKTRNANISFLEYKERILSFLKKCRGSKIEITIDVACNFNSLLQSMIRMISGLMNGERGIPDTIDDLRCNFTQLYWELLSDKFASRLHARQRADSYLNSVRNDDYEGKNRLKVTDNIYMKIKPFFYGRRLSEFQPLINGRPCGTETLSILANGNVVPCCIVYDDILKLGNINDEPLEAIISRNIQNIRNIKTGINLPRTCMRCMGAPTIRGAIIKELHHRIAGK